jgi:arylsulfatase A-like enzyme
MFFNLMEGHMPFLAPDEYLKRFDPDVERNVWGDYEGLHERTVQDSDRIVDGLLDKYDGCISYLDSVVDRMITILRDRGVLDDTYLFILGDHGEAFGEHGIYGHTGGLYNEITHVPLLVRPPGGADEKSITRPVSVQWIMPTILNEVNMDIPDRCVDQHLFERSKVPVVFESSGLGIDANHPDIERFFEEMRGGIHDEQKLIAGETWEEVYALSDRMETKPLSESQKIGEVIEAEIARYDPTERREVYSDQELTSGTQEQLRKLGYMK